MSLPIRVRLSMWYAVLLIVILIATGALAVFILRSEMTAMVDRQLRTSGGELATDMATASAQTESEFKDVTDASLGGLPRDASAAQLLSPSGTVLLSAGNGAAATPMLTGDALAQAQAGVTALWSRDIGGAHYRVIAQPAISNGQQAVLVIATSISSTEAAIRRLELLLAILIPVGVALSAWGGWWLAGKGLGPVARMTDEAAAISVDRLDDRVEVPPTMDEIGRLAVTLNSMLERIQTASDRQRAFVSDASHELRTPLAIMRAELDVSLGTPNLSDEPRATLLSAREETDRMARLVENLLLLARMDEGALSLAHEPFDLRDVTKTAVGDLSILADERGIRITVSAGPPVIVAGDAARTEQVVRNLLENAIKHSPQGAAVSAAVEGDRTSGHVVVADTGAGIPPDALPHIFERFYRVDTARSREGGGSGLGLAIVRELVQAQSGTVSASSDGSGTRMTCSFPAASPVALGDRAPGTRVAPASGDGI
jgi:heavy metal sensor kinase